MAKLGLCIGINDYGAHANDLKGALNDEEDWRTELVNRGFQVKSLRDGQASKSRVLSEMAQLIGDAVEGDTVVITFSGHGAFMLDDDIEIEGEVGEEEDFRDEALVVSGMELIVDDEVRKVFEPTRDGVKLVFIADCCSSGTIAEKLAGPSKVGIEREEPQHEVGRGRRLELDQVSSDAKQAARAQQKSLAKEALPRKALLLSACDDGDAVAKESKTNGKWNGAYTRAALDVLPKDPQSYEEWHALIVKKLKARHFVQDPQIQGTKSQKQSAVFG